ncbi:hypothetical protein [Microlunatus sp. GCM10028923]
MRTLTDKLTGEEAGVIAYTIGLALAINVLTLRLSEMPISCLVHHRL